MGRDVNLQDNMQSLLTSLGKKSEGRRYGHSRPLSRQTAWNVYRGSWIAQKFVNKTAEDMVKRWREPLAMDLLPEMLERFSLLEKQFKIKEVAEECLIWMSLFGECLILAVTDIDNADYALPIDLDRENIQRFVVVDNGAYRGRDRVQDIASSQFGMPEYYLINDLEVHHSRVFYSVAGMKPLSKMSSAEMGVSDLQACYSAISMFDTISTCISDLSEESKVDIQKIQGLNDQISAGREDSVLRYASIAAMSKSQSGMILLDADTEYEQKEVSFSGLADIWVKAGNVLAGALDRPVTVLFGQSASGFNSGEEDNKNYYDTILSLQESRLRPLLDFIDGFLLKLLPDEIGYWNYVFPSLDTMNKLDEANIFSQWSQGLCNLVSNQLMTTEMALKELKQRGIFHNICDEDIVGLMKVAEPDAN